MNRRSFFKTLLSSFVVLAMAPLSVLKPTTAQAAENVIGFDAVNPPQQWDVPQNPLSYGRIPGTTATTYEFNTMFYCHPQDGYMSLETAIERGYSQATPARRIRSASYAEHLAHGGEPITIAF